jgi:hypothetical protein
MIDVDIHHVYVFSINKNQKVSDVFLAASSFHTTRFIFPKNIHAPKSPDDMSFARSTSNFVLQKTFNTITNHERKDPTIPTRL